MNLFNQCSPGYRCVSHLLAFGPGHSSGLDSDYNVAEQRVAYFHREKRGQYVGRGAEEPKSENGETEAESTDSSTMPGAENNEDEEENVDVLVDLGTTSSQQDSLQNAIYQFYINFQQRLMDISEFATGGESGTTPTDNIQPIHAPLDSGNGRSAPHKFWGTGNSAAIYEEGCPFRGRSWGLRSTGANDRKPGDICIPQDKASSYMEIQFAKKKADPIASGKCKFCFDWSYTGYDVQLCNSYGLRNQRAEDGSVGVLPPCMCVPKNAPGRITGVVEVPGVEVSKNDRFASDASIQKGKPGKVSVPFEILQHNSLAPGGGGAEGGAATTGGGAGTQMTLFPILDKHHITDGQVADKIKQVWTYTKSNNPRLQRENQSTRTRNDSSDKVSKQREINDALQQQRIVIIPHLPVADFRMTEVGSGSIKNPVNKDGRVAFGPKASPGGLKWSTKLPPVIPMMHSDITSGENRRGRPFEVNDNKNGVNLDDTVNVPPSSRKNYNTGRIPWSAAETIDHQINKSGLNILHLIAEKYQEMNTALIDNHVEAVKRRAARIKAAYEQNKALSANDPAIGGEIPNLDIDFENDMNKTGGANGEDSKNMESTYWGIQNKMINNIKKRVGCSSWFQNGDTYLNQKGNELSDEGWNILRSVMGFERWRNRCKDYEATLQKLNINENLKCDGGFTSIKAQGQKEDSNKKSYDEYSKAKQWMIQCILEHSNYTSIFDMGHILSNALSVK